MDLKNTELSKKVLRALNPNEILDKDQVEKSKKVFNSLARITAKRENNENSTRAKALTKGIERIDSKLEEKPKKKGFFTRKNNSEKKKNNSEKKGFFTRRSKPVVENKRSNVEKALGVDPKNKEKWMASRRKKAAKPNISFNEAFPSKKSSNTFNTVNPLL